MNDPYLDVLTGYTTTYPELQNINHMDLVKIIEGDTLTTSEIRKEAVSIFNTLYPELTGYTMEDIDSNVPMNPFFDDPLKNDLL